MTARMLLRMTCTLILALVGATTLMSQHAIDTGRGLAMAPPDSYAYTSNEPFHHLGVQLQGGFTRIDDYPYSVGPAYPTVVADHIIPLSLTATVTVNVDLFDLPLGIGIGYQRTLLRSDVDYAGVPIHRLLEGDTVSGSVLFRARNDAQSFILDLSLDLIRLELGIGQIYMRTGLRNRGSFQQGLTETIEIPGSVGARRLVLDDGLPQFDNGAGVVLVSSDLSEFLFDVTFNVGLGWRMGFPDLFEEEEDEESLGPGPDPFGPILIIPMIDFYLPVLGAHPVEHASWEVMVGVGFVMPL